MDSRETAIALDQLDALLAEFEKLPWHRSRKVFPDGRPHSSWKTDHALEMRIISAVQRLTPPGLSYAKHLHNPGSLVENVEVVQALRADIAAGYLSRASELVRADIFADMLEGAEYLLTENWKDAAAVMIGGVLEAHIRLLCVKHKIDTTKASGGRTEPRPTSALNMDLYKANVYSKLTFQDVTAWLTLRNHAAHGDHGAYDEKQVKSMLDGVRSFIDKLSA